MAQLDPRLHAYRDDLAAASLQNLVRAPRFSEGELRQVAAPAAPVRVAPRFDAHLATEALSGELVTVFDYREGWAWVQLREDGYVGYTPVDHLSGMVEENNYRVSARLTYLYPVPDIKQPPITKLSFSCTVAPIGRLEGRFAELSRGGFIFADHLVSARERAKDFVRVAERFVGVPYLWGGKTALGIDCSGLVQISIQAAGVQCLRDTDMQIASLGERIDPSNLDSIQRGDLLFWKGHVAIAQSGDWMIHASGHHMEVVVEPIRRALERTAESHGPLLAIVRPNIEQKAAPVQTAGGQAAAPAQANAPSKPATQKLVASVQAQGAPRPGPARSESGPAPIPFPGGANAAAAKAAPAANQATVNKGAANQGAAVKPAAPAAQTAPQPQAASQPASQERVQPPAGQSPSQEKAARPAEKPAPKAAG